MNEIGIKIVSLLSIYLKKYICHVFFYLYVVNLFAYFIFRYCLLRTLRQCQMTLDFLKELKKEVKWHGRGKNEAAHYCTNCEVSKL